jgi:hypothetical protein
MQAPLPRSPAHWAGPDGPARTRSIVDQRAPFASARGHSREGLVVRGMKLALIAYLPVSVSVVSEPGGGRGRSRQTMSDLKEAVTPQSRAISARGILTIGVPEFVPDRLGGSAASLPVRGFM